MRRTSNTKVVGAKPTHIKIRKQKAGLKQIIGGSGAEEVPEVPAASGAGQLVSAPTGKLAILIELLKREQGAAISDMTAATGWQAHSVRGAISGSLKKKLSLNVVSEKTDAGRTYRIVEEAAA